MKRDWELVKSVLEHIEKGDFVQYIEEGNYIADGIDEKDYFGHIEILLDAGIIKNGSITRNARGQIISYGFNGLFITMRGHDLLDALRDKNVWNRIKQKSINTGVSISWEFIKAAIPVVMKDIVGG